MPNKFQKVFTLGKGLIKKFVEQQFHFQPYLKPLNIKGIDAVFYFGTPQAAEWYDPIKTYALIEYDWVLENIDLKNKKIIDAGAHHGQYSVVFAKGSNNSCDLISVDPFPMNCLLTNINRCLNDLNFDIVEKAISNKAGEISFSNESNGHITSKGELVVKTTTLSLLMPDAEIVKLDVEGEEFKIVPHELDKMKNVQTWIIEVHPSNNRKPNDLIKLFQERDYQVLWVNRDTGKVEEYQMNSDWSSHSTIFCLKK